jgi:dehydrogenase/reductase SDR family protein 7B
MSGASSGIGKAIAIEAVREGAKVILSARRENLLQKIKEEELLTLTKAENIKILPLDLGELETLKAKGSSERSFQFFLAIIPPHRMRKIFSQN